MKQSQRKGRRGSNWSPRSRYMRVLCRACGAQYRVDHTRLRHTLNKTRCRRCDAPMVIRKPDAVGEADATLLKERKGSGATTRLAPPPTPAEAPRGSRWSTTNPFEDGSLIEDPVQDDDLGAVSMADEVMHTWVGSAVGSSDEHGQLYSLENDASFSHTSDQGLEEEPEQDDEDWHEPAALTAPEPPRLPAAPVPLPRPTESDPALDSDQTSSLTGGLGAHESTDPSPPSRELRHAHRELVPGEPLEERIPAADGLGLAASVWRPAAGRELDWVIIGPGVGHTRARYHALAAWLARAGWSVVTYDPRGVGESLEGDVRRVVARLQDWAELDLAGVVAWVQRQRPGRVVVYGHAETGQLLGLIPDTGIDAGVLINAGSGSWRQRALWLQPWVWLYYRLVVPLVVAWRGFFPAGVPLPPGVARQWAAWACQADYLWSMRGVVARYRNFRSALLVLSMADDQRRVPVQAVRSLARRYGGRVDLRVIDPARDAGLGRLGHDGFFDPASEPLWRQALDWVESQTRGE